jgi:hypothetical protein
MLRPPRTAIAPPANNSLLCTRIDAGEVPPCAQNLHRCGTTAGHEWVRSRTATFSSRDAASSVASEPAVWRSSTRRRTLTCRPAAFPRCRDQAGPTPFLSKCSTGIPRKGNAQDEVIERGFGVLEDLETVNASMDEMKVIALKPRGQRAFATAAPTLRHGERTEGQPPAPITAGAARLAAPDRGPRG